MGGLPARIRGRVYSAGDMCTSAPEPATDREGSGLRGGHLSRLPVATSSQPCDRELMTEIDSVADATLARVRSQTIGDIPRRTARRVPDKVAIIDGDVTLTFAQFDALVDRVAAALHANGLAAGDRVALLSRNSWQYAFWRSPLLGPRSCWCPVNFMLTGERSPTSSGTAGLTHSSPPPNSWPPRRPSRWPELPHPGEHQPGRLGHRRRVARLRRLVAQRPSGAPAADR